MALFPPGPSFSLLELGARSRPRLLNWHESKSWHVLGVGPARNRNCHCHRYGGLFGRVKDVVQDSGTLKGATVGMGCQWRGVPLALPVPHPTLSPELEEVWELRV